MKKMLFIAKYPRNELLKEGMFQRIKHIDNIFYNESRIYLEISYKKNFKCMDKEFLDGSIVYHVNYFKHRKFIKQLINENDVVYIHSLYNLLKLYGFKKQLNKKYVLDFHGTVPEEFKFNNKKIMFKILKFLEKRLLNQIDIGVYVTNSMKKFYESTSNLNKGIVYPIYPKNTLKDFEYKEIINSRKNKGIDINDVVIVYSGNMQRWQNINLMLKNIKKIEINKNYKIIIMTGEKERFKEKLVEFGVKNVELISVNPDELSEYYKIANFGYILRDKNILNEVACPTKMIEYMFYGIIPIVLEEKIGDFIELGYEFINLEDVSCNLQNIKSDKNRKIIIDVINKNTKVENALKKYLLN